MIDEQEIKIIAALADVDPRTVRRVVLEGQRARAVADRIALEKALRERGHKAAARKVANG